MERAAVLPTHTVFSSCAIDIDRNQAWVHVSLTGELDSVDAGPVAQLLVDAVNAGTPVVRLELSGLTFADSSAISAILFGAQAAEGGGVDFQLLNPRPRLRQILDITGLAEVLTVVYESGGQDGQNLP
jgi:anti-sigma B factor antagonist